MSQDGTVGPNEHSWHRHSNLLFVDEPFGVGLSRGDLAPEDYDSLADHLVAFLKLFKERHSYVTRICLASESLGGKVNIRLWQRLHQGAVPGLLLTGVVLVSQWLESRAFYARYAQVAREARLVTPADLKGLAEQERLCLASLAKEDEALGLEDVKVCFDYVDYILGTPPRVDKYNIDYKPQSYDPYLKYNRDLEALFKSGEANHFLQHKDDSLVKSWLRFSGKVSTRFKRVNFLRGDSLLLKKLVETGLPVLVMHGDKDFISCVDGVLELLAGVQLMPRLITETKGSMIYEFGNNLRFVSIKDSGHMACFENPGECYKHVAMID